ncbi:tetracycline resistance protein TetA [Paenibacillus yonginensis]|uniref:Tetracycline resistance protein TetA n=1 Tax=Paenibacillus yonginensis TaxID=1462996 RepID=A0A1B1MX93_9BACL|nr:MFS transporter [Paenibacillus yonginensis]ANS73786.1 tetracycline resistance protein TetA [Paenibacillus yonginensis]
MLLLLKPKRKKQSASSGIKKEGLFTILLGIAVVLQIMNTTMFNLAIPKISSQFELTPSVASLIVTVYSIVFAVAAITYSRLSDFIPLRRMMIFGLLVLGLSALAGIFSSSFIFLLIMRIIQAIGAGSVLSLGMVLFTRYIPVERRGKAMAFIMSAVSLGLGLGPVIGGMIVDYLGWRYLFAVIALVLLLIPFFYVLMPREVPKKGVFDTLGAIFIAIGTSGVLLYLTNHYLIALFLGIIGIILFIIRIRTSAHPFVQPSLFRNGRYLSLALTGVFSYMVSFGILFLIPQVLVHRFGFTASHAGFIIFPGSLCAIIASRKVGSIIDRHGNSSLLRFMPLVLLTGTVLFALFAADSWLSILFFYILVSLSFSTLTSSVSNQISRVLQGPQVGAGMGLYQLLQFFSGAFSVALASSAMEWQKGRVLQVVYTNIFWGMALLAVICVLCSLFYSRSSSLAAESNKGSVPN